MTKREYLDTLRARLSQLPAEELTKQLAYYGELLDDMAEDGMDEQAAAEKLGNVDALAADILQQQPLPVLVRSRVRPRRGWSALGIVLLILGSPIWLSVGLTLFAVALTIYVVLWTVVIVLFAADLAVAVSGLAILLGWLLNLLSAPIPALMLLGGFLACAGVAILLFLLALYSAKGVVFLTAAMNRGVKRLFIRKESV